MDSDIKMVPALCTQCGGRVEVDREQETAKCPFCGTTFMIEKAVNNYNVKFAHIDHADKVNIEVGDAVKDVLGFVGEQMKESREERREQRREDRERQRKMDTAFLKIFGFMAAGMMVFALVAFCVMQFTGGFDDASNKAGEERAVIDCRVENGFLYTDVTGPDVPTWCYQENYSKGTVLKSEDNDAEGYHSCVAADDIEEGEAYVVSAAWGENFGEADSPLYYSVVEVTINDHEIVSATEPEIIDSLDDYDFD